MRYLDACDLPKVDVWLLAVAVAVAVTVAARQPLRQATRNDGF
jgi:hypothetical protein